VRAYCFAPLAIQLVFPVPVQRGIQSIAHFIAHSAHPLSYPIVS